jgi:CTP:molybdopterin cytidylyltransferase MocA
MADRVAGVLLAAGGGRRMGGPKALLRYDGRLLVERGTDLLRDGGCDPVHVVIGAAADQVLATASLGDAVAVRNEDWETGLASSLRAGLLSIPSDVDAAVVALADQPGVTPEVIRRLVSAYRDGARLAVATYGGKPRNPTLLTREAWPDVLTLATGDVGARAYLRAHPDAVTPVPCDDIASPHDLDTPADLPS